MIPFICALLTLIEETKNFVHLKLSNGKHWATCIRSDADTDQFQFVKLRSNSMMHEQSQQDDHGYRHTQHPQQKSSSHFFLLTKGSNAISTYRLKVQRLCLSRLSTSKSRLHGGAARRIDAYKTRVQFRLAKSLALHPDFYDEPPPLGSLHFQPDL